MRAILLDIEGTTTPVSFVHSVLFPFAGNKVREFVRQRGLEIQPEIAQLRGEHAEDFNEGNYRQIFNESCGDSVSAYLQFLIDIDRKSPPLKSIQGKIWQAGYESGELVSQIYDDVPPALRKWKSEGKTVSIYSSGSALAQKLIFKYSEHGDLTEYIDTYFDTDVGHKRDPQSYQTVATELGQLPKDVLFLSDVGEELDAARISQMKTVLVNRQNDAAELPDAGHQLIRTFDELTGTSDSK